MKQENFDPKLGQQVHQELLKLGIETPFGQHSRPSDPIANISTHIAAIMDILGLDRTDESLCETPRRVAKMMVQESFWGLDYDHFPKCTRITNKMNYRGSYVLERKIPIFSTCEHHLVPIIGTANIANKTKNYILGLSKFNRIADFFARRPQVQERLTEQIRAALAFVTETEHVAVQIEAAHLCVQSRGVRHTECSTITFSGSGDFDNPQAHARQDFVADCRP